MSAITWMQWQHAVVELIRSDYYQLIPHVQMDDVDWEAWRPLFEQGCTPEVAVSSALSPTPRTEQAA